MPLAVCATPIGNLEDVTLRVLRELAEADLALCEDTRRTRVLLDRHGIWARLASYRAQRGAEDGRAPAAAHAGERIALVSDAGLPGVSDPGGRSSGGARRRVPVTVLPGLGRGDGARGERVPAERYQFRRVPPPRRAAP